MGVGRVEGGEGRRSRRYRLDLGQLRGEPGLELTHLLRRFVRRDGVQPVPVEDRVRPLEELVDCEPHRLDLGDVVLELARGDDVGSASRPPRPRAPHPTATRVAPSARPMMLDRRPNASDAGISFDREPTYASAHLGVRTDGSSVRHRFAGWP